jgi:hypothetical protein
MKGWVLTLSQLEDGKTGLKLYMTRGGYGI